MNLSAASVTVRFGAVAALQDVSLEIASGERRALIGPNGAGKTTLFDVITGSRRPTSGRVLLAGADVTRVSTSRRARLGLARTFQRSALFPDLTSAENLALAVRARMRIGWRVWPSRTERTVAGEVSSRLEAAGLASLARRPARTLAHGEQRSLEIELALAGQPRLLLLDEPMAGLSGAERQSAVIRLQALPEEVTLVLVEHDLDVVFAVAQRISVLDHGVLIAEGTPAEIRADHRVQEVYLGRGE
ncbi:MAG: ABC transporter ATP-binding protein [Candidatus Dormibacteraeota bacterium]|nr:ABC transporter ATP-binding protein [Candidatus Dormibacteraeota bacterium]